ncbi:MAG: hypothetical protein K0R73_1469 [Candidatus Midichloriaceae bacterium]|jgi:hypothetical protein|nr:hypothetical protein [Candidatus Midichloriaceae bacterium]
MTIHNETKINHLLQHWPKDSVMTAAWLKKLGISTQLLAHYQKSHWVEDLSKGVFKRAGDSVSWSGGVYAMQRQALVPMHVGGLTAMALQGSGHYIRFKNKIQLFGVPKTNLPRWFKNYKWDESIEYYRSAFLPDSLALTEFEDKTFSITISTLERAILECLYLVPTKVDLVEYYQIMEGLVSLRPYVLKELLEECTSVKVKRLEIFWS